MNPLCTAVLLLVSLAMVGCRGKHEDHHQEAKFLVTSPLRKETQLTREYVGQIRAIQHIELRALERGYLQGIFVDEGQRVQKDARMFQLMPLIYQAELQKAGAEAEVVEIEFRNTKLLAEKNIVSPNELAMAKARVDKAKAEVALAWTHKSLTEIKAPFEGLLGRFLVRMGSLVSEGELLTTLSDNSRVWVYFNVSETEYLDYQSSREEGAEPTPVNLVMANGQLFDQPGKVETIEADFNNETGNLAFRATFDNPKRVLRHGETGKIQMSVPLKNALLIPQQATFDVLDKKFVYVVDDKNVVRSRPITVAAELPHLFAVARGLEERDKIVVEGLRKVRDGSTIQKPQYVRPEELLGRLEVPAE